MKGTVELTGDNALTEAEVERLQRLLESGIAHSTGTDHAADCPGCTARDKLTRASEQT